MTWLFLAVTSYFLNAIVSLTDKFLLSKKAKDPLIYAFYSGILTSFVVILWPIDFEVLSPDLTVIALLSGAAFFMALFFYYSAILEGEVSRVVPVVGGVSPIVIFCLSYVFLNERLPELWLWGFFMLVLGTVVFTFGKGKKTSIYSFVAAVAFAVSFFLSKLVFLETSFLNGFVWTRVGAVLPSLVLVFTPFFKKIHHLSGFNIKKRSFGLFLSNKVLSAVAFFILNYSIALGPLTIINALQGVQYVFLFILTLIFSAYFPRIVSESLRRGVIIQKIVGIVLISLSFVVLFVFGDSM